MPTTADMMCLATGWLRSAGLPPWIAPTLATAGIVLGITIIVLQVRSDRRRASSYSRPREPDPDAGPLHGVMRDAEELIDRLAARADAQAQRLESLIARAESAERRLAEQQTRITSAPQPPTRPAANPQPKLKPPPRRAIPEETAAEAEHADVYELADRGLAAPEIARRLGQPQGEVELILSLRRL